MFGNFSEEALEAFNNSFDFAECQDGEKMVFGVCRKVGGSGQGEKDWDQDKKTKQEEEIEGAAKKQGVDINSKLNKKAITIGGKKYGMAIKNGKIVLVEWGSVAGEKKVGPKKPVKGAGQNRRASGTSGLNATSRDAYIRGQEAAMAKQTTDSGRAAIQANIDRARAGA
jgi:hypothetical protein